jgi:acyl-CoA synthetase (AMP-forming)/AMP-acid ligase II
MNIVPDLLGSACTRYPERTAVRSDENALRFREVDERAERLRAVLAELGLRPGDRLALLARNRCEHLEIHVAASRAGLILVPLNFRLAVPELAYIVGDCAPHLLICGPELADAAAELDVAHRLVLDGSYESALDAAVPMSGPLPSAAADAANLILYTSGTTGRPKGAVISNHGLFARIHANLFEYQISPEDRFLQCLPLFHIAANVTSSYAFAGATNLLLADFSPRAVLELIETERVTSALLVPTMINALINDPTVGATDLSSLHTVAYGASPIPPAVLRRAMELFGCEFLQLFGMTETSACTVLRRQDHAPKLHPQRLASAGTEALGCAVRIVDDADRDVPAGSVGEVICRGPTVMDGYWNAAQATADALRGGWMHTGDLGYRDADGYVFITDRKKDMIISGGENVYPREVEDVLFEHPDVLEAAVIGVPDERWGERVHAVLVPAAGAALDPDAVLQFVRTRLAGYKVPKSAEVVGELPKNATGKVLKTVLREPWWAGKQRGIG